MLFMDLLNLSSISFLNLLIRLHRRKDGVKTLEGLSRLMVFYQLIHIRVM